METVEKAYSLADRNLEKSIRPLKNGWNITTLIFINSFYFSPGLGASRL
jgi:hypothetical protein